MSDTNTKRFLRIEVETDNHIVTGFITSGEIRAGIIMSREAYTELLMSGFFLKDGKLRGKEGLLNESHTYVFVPEPEVVGSAKKTRKAAENDAATPEQEGALQQPQD